MFTKEEKEKAKNFKFSFRPLDELEQYLHPKFLSVIDQNSISDKGNDLGIIPKHIMIFWHSEQLPEDVNNSINKIRQYNSGYQIQIFNEKSAGKFIQQYYGSEFYHLYERRCVHFSMKSDLFRMCYLLQKGGIYVDVDVDCHSSLEEIFKFYQFNCFFFFSKGKPCCIDNDFIVCQPNNSIILAILEKIKENLIQKRSFSSVWECTGPGAVSIVILELLMQDILTDCCNFSHLKNLKLGNRDLAIRAYSPADLNYKKTIEGNWRRFRLPKHLHLL